MTVSSTAKAGAKRPLSATSGRDKLTLGMPVESRLAIEHAITRLLDESESVALAMPQAIRVICEALGWVCGGCWRAAGNTLADARCAETWGAEAPEIEAFLDVTRRHQPAKQPGGLIGRAWAERKPVWIR
ncbi:MAG TPA: hypothetical protein VLJ12_05115, partial [Burkholderiales bacterium]|nr:hypothetical protein [Burkholderiales bacterium]